MSKTKRNNTFRFPFDINPMVFIVLAIVFFILSIRQVSDYLLPKVNVEKLGKKIESDIQAKIAKFRNVSKDKTLFDLAIKDSLSESQHAQLMNEPFSFQIYDNNKLKFWNSVNVDIIGDSLPEGRPCHYRSNNGQYVLYTEKWGNAMEKRAVLVIPVKRENLFQGYYMKNYFSVYNKEEDFGIKVSSDSIKGAVAIRWNNTPLMYLHATDDYFLESDNNILHLIYDALTFIFFGISIHTYFKVMVKKRKPIMIFLMLVSTAVIVRVMTFIIGFPNDYTQYELFSPEYFASNAINRSIGDVFINVCLCFWVLLFFAVNVQGKILPPLSKKHKYIFGVIVLCVCTVLHMFFIDLIYSIVLDSVINFDTTLVSKLTLFSFIGLLAFLVIFANLFLVSFITNNYVNVCFRQRKIKYILLLVIVLITTLLYNNEHGITYVLYYIWAVAVFFVLDYTSSKIRFDFNSIYLLVWIMLVSFFGSYLLTGLNLTKEHITRKKFAENIMKEKDVQLEIRLENFKSKLMQDEALKKFFITDRPGTYNDVADYIYLHYFDSYLNKYKFYIKIFDAKGKNLNPMDTSSLAGFRQNMLHNYTLTADSQIYYKEEHEDYYYNTVCPIVFDNKEVGTVVYTLYETLSMFDENNTDFIIYGGLKSEYKEYKYSMAIYEDSKIVTRKGVYSFGSRIDTKEIFKDNNLLFTSKGEYDEMWYHFPNKRKTIVIVKKTNTFIMLTTLFAYNFLIYFSTISLYILGNIIARSNLNTMRFFNLLSLNLKLKIQLSILFVVFMSFIVIGYLTTRYLSNRIKEKARIEISDYAQLIQNELAPYFVNKADDSMLVQNNIINSAIIDNIEKLSKRFDVNLSLYNVNDGLLVYSSQADLFQAGVFSSLIPHNIFYNLKNADKEHVINPETIGNFGYVASYSFIRDTAGTPIAILQLPYIFSNFEINSETNSVIVTIVNIYVFVFLISSLLSLFISNSVSRPFKFIVKQFTQINLSKTNEPLKWNSSDEIGMMVKEYNRMLRKLENSTVLLAKNERELAWREMAKQVAHEIKNPLTPMKLSLQMLERAIKNNNPNVTEMTSRVTNTMIEQIDNLSVIATNFSNFAKLPEIKKEVIVLNEVLYSVTGMYNDSADFEYLFLIPDYPIHIYADKGQLIRVFTNIIQNAIQAIPQSSKGYISLLVSKIKNNFVRISISDNGEGISKEKGKKLFQPYFTTKTSGTGLGLAMCKDIVEQFEGRIEYESVLKEGTTFHIDLPLIVIEDENIQTVSIT